MLDPLISRTLGRYLIQAEIGRGGMARVYRALDTVLQRPVALKVLQPSLSADPEFSRRFEREAITAANVRHPAIVTIYDVGEADQLRYIAMEYIAGRTLMEVLQERGRLGLPLTIAILEPVAQALDYAHQQGMVHRDIKPHNIMVDMDGRVLLTDFGIAIGQNEPGERLTRTGVFMGTPEYISPEQAQSQPLTGHSDLYSLAVVAYEMLSGQVPFGGGTAQQIMAHAYHAPPPFTSMDSTQPPELNDVFNRALAKDPHQRFISASTLVDALRGIARRYGMAPATRDAIAELSQPRGGSAGQATMLLGTPQPSSRSVPPPSVPALAAPVVPLAQGANDVAYGASTVPASRGTNNPPVGAVPRGGVGRVGGGGDRLPPGARLPARPADDEGGGRLPWALLAIAAIAIALVIFALMRLFGAGDPLGSPSDPNAEVLVSASAIGGVDFVNEPLPTGTQTQEAIPTALRTATPTNTTEPTNTPVPTNTSVPPTNTSVPPTGTSVPPTKTSLPTDTPLPPTATGTATATPSVSPLPSVLPTNTPPPTETPTPLPPTPTETPTPLPPTNTPLPPTPTETLTPTETFTPTETTTQTPVNTATSTPEVAGTPPTVTATISTTTTITITETVTTTETITTTETATTSSVAFGVDAAALTPTATVTPRSAAFVLPAAFAADTATIMLNEQIAVLRTTWHMIYTAHIPLMLPHTAIGTPTGQAHAAQPHITPTQSTATTRSQRAFVAR